eukprot:CAMPEP_0113665590 /NCGR_PEP_ID=MMETSP0038_2-20120614/2388_1 /TAXON_ID=2898 /ORGANISM="Cryptomonas paramecium" /LENGTH=196 /DNA_ID=CAMNT_0000580957 /DNA_START=1 /DNA_END=591 /DNA_ORIENTATION=+ /assembly_acc=CAM_ASM_000170
MRFKPSFENLSMDDLSADRLYNNAVQYKKEGKFELAAKTFRKALEVDSKHCPSLLGLGSLIKEHPEVQIGVEDHRLLLTAVTRQVCCPPELKKATLAINAIHRMTNAVKLTALKKDSEASINISSLKRDSEASVVNFPPMKKRDSQVSVKRDSEASTPFLTDMNQLQKEIPFQTQTGRDMPSPFLNRISARMVRVK